MIIIGAKCTRAQDKAEERKFYLVNFSLFIQLVEKGLCTDATNQAPIRCASRTCTHHSSAIDIPERPRMHHQAT